MASDSFLVRKSLNIEPIAGASPTSEGDITYNLTTHKAIVHNGTSASSLVTEAHSATLTNKTFDADGTGNSITNIENADIKSAAAIALNKLAAATASRALVSDASGFVSPATTTSTEIGYVNGVTSAIQTQIDTKASSSSLSSHTGASTGVHGVVGSVVGNSDSQTLTNKTIDSDSNTLSNITNTNIKTAAAIALNKLAASTVSRALVSDASGFVSPATTTSTEIGYVNGVTSAIQTQINTKAPTASPTFSGTITTPLTASRALATGSSSELAVSATTSIELGYVNGVTSSIQTQLDAKIAKTLTTTTGDIIYASSANTPARLAIGSTNNILKVTAGVPSWASLGASFTAPTVQKFTSGTGTYTTPASVLYIKIKMVGGGGGGAGSGTAAGTVATAGAASTFGTTLLSAGGGAPGVWNNANPAGGTASLGTGPIGTAVTGGYGSAGDLSVAAGTSQSAGGSGGISPYFGGSGTGGQYNSVGTAGITNTGGGGQGGPSSGGGVNNLAGCGGGSGGFIDAIITSPSATYAYVVGAGGNAGTAGTAGTAGGAGGSGYIEVQEFYQ